MSFCSFFLVFKIKKVYNYLEGVIVKKRIISAIIMTLIFIPFLLLGDIWYSVFVGILGLVSLWELIRLEKNIPIYMQVLSYIICLLIIWAKYQFFLYFCNFIVYFEEVCNDLIECE